MVREDEGRMTKGEGRSSLVIRRYLLSPVSFREYIPRVGMFANGNLYALVCSEAIHRRHGWRHGWRNYEQSFWRLFVVRRFIAAMDGAMNGATTNKVSGACL